MRAETHQQRTVAHEQINSNVAESNIRTARSCNYVIKRNRVSTSSSAATPRASHSPDIRKHGGRGHSRSNVTLPCLFFFVKMKMVSWTCISSEQRSCQRYSRLAHYFWVCYPWIHGIKADFRIRWVLIPITVETEQSRVWSALERCRFTAMQILCLSCRASKWQMFDFICNLRKPAKPFVKQSL